MKTVYVCVEQIRINRDEWEMEDEEFERLQKMNCRDQLTEITKMLDTSNFYIDEETLLEFDEVVR